MTGRLDLRWGSARIAALLLASSPFLGSLPVAAQTPEEDPAAAPADAATVVAHPPQFGDEITVTATRSPRAVADTPGAVTVVSGEEIDRRLHFGIEDLVRYEPGVYVDRESTRLGANGFNIRGIGGNRVLTQVDGIETAEQFDFGPLSISQYSLDLQSLARVEVVKSAGSSLYGSDALGGVVSLVTKDPQDYLTEAGGGRALGAELGFDSRSEEGSAGLSAAAAWGRLQGSLFLSRRDGGELGNQGTVATADRSRTAPNPQDRESDNLLGKLVWSPSDRSRFELAVEGFDGETRTAVLSSQGIDDQSALFGPGVTFLVDTQDFTAVDVQERYRVSLEQSYQAGGGGPVDRFEWRVYAQSSRTEQDTDEHRVTTREGGFFGPRRTTEVLRRGTFDFDQDTAGVELQLQKGIPARSGGHLLTYGVSASRDRFDVLRDRVEIDPATGTPIPPAPGGLIFPTKYFPESEVTELGVYVQDELTLARGRLALVPGLRYDHYRLDPDETDPVFLAGNPGTEAPVGITDEAVSPRLGLVVRAARSTAVFVQYARGFRSPPYSAVNNGFANLAQGYTTLPNPDLQPETSDNLELGLRGGGRRGSYSVVVFENRYDDFIDTVTRGFNPATGLLEFQPQNVEDVELRGVELAGQLTLDRGFALRGAFAWIEGEDRAADRPLNSVAPPQLVLGLRYDQPAGRWGAELVSTVVATKAEGDVDRTTVDQFAPPGYEVLDLTGYVDLSERLRLGLALLNLLDETYWRWPAVRGQVAGSATLDRYTSPGFEAAATLRYRF
jgi:hemoglobin/transferrin/lactoferrin receptor protein